MAQTQRFSKNFRLRKRADYLLMNSRSSGRMSLAGYTVVARLNGGQVSRLGVTVTRRIGRAVVRNRLKRRVREFFRLNRYLWPQGLDILFIARKHSADLWPPQPWEVARLEKFFRIKAGAPD
ncbi:MAG: ribonuclease P protein component [Deltaproteobacteria bacterium]|jgi:ribonuclease P protein component|nr:ribonuclease P protein component [Deltaproteobacteria bacterium]